MFKIQIKLMGALDCILNFVAKKGAKCETQKCL